MKQKNERVRAGTFLVVISAFMLLINNVRILSSSASLIPPPPPSLNKINFNLPKRGQGPIRVVLKGPPKHTPVFPIIFIYFFRYKEIFIGFLQNHRPPTHRSSTHRLTDLPFIKHLPTDPPTTERIHRPTNPSTTDSPTCLKFQDQIVNLILID